MSVEKLEKPKKNKHGGKRPNSGRKPDLQKKEVEKIKILISKHGTEIDDLRKKQRILALLDVLYDLGTQGNAVAIKEYFDRQLGKASQPVEGKINVGLSLVQLFNQTKDE